MTRYLELRRHAPNDGDVLTREGTQLAVDLGARLQGPYHIAYSSGAQRATQTLACLFAGLGEQVPNGVVVEPGLRSDMEDRWIAAYRRAGSAELAALRSADPELVEIDSVQLGAVLRRLIESLPGGARALAVAHGATSEAAVFGLTGVEVPPLGHGAGVAITLGPNGFKTAVLSATVASPNVSSTVDD